MKLHYLFSNRRVVTAAVITFNGERQNNCIQADDIKGFIIRRRYGNNPGLETLYGRVTIEVPALKGFAAYKTKEPTT